MKVFRYWLAVVVGAVVPTELALGTGNVGTATDKLAIDGPGGDGRRAKVKCPVLKCTPHLHFCGVGNYTRTDRCETLFYSDIDNQIVDDDSFFLGVCAKPFPTVLTLSHLLSCVDKIGSVSFTMFQDGVLIRNSTDSIYPYTVFGDRKNPFRVNSRVLGNGSAYKLNIDIKSPKGCVMLHQYYAFAVESDFAC